MYSRTLASVFDNIVEHSIGHLSNIEGHLVKRAWKYPRCYAVSFIVVVEMEEVMSCKVSNSPLYRSTCG